MADSDSSAPRTRKLSVRLPPADCLLTISETLDVLCASDPMQRLAWFEDIREVINAGSLPVRYRDGRKPRRGTIGATHGMATHVLCADLAAWLRGEGLAVTHDDTSEATPTPETETPEQRRERAAELYSALNNYAAVGRELGVSRTRAKQLVDAHQPTGAVDSQSTGAVHTSRKATLGKGKK